MFEGLCPEFAHVFDIQPILASVGIQLLHQLFDEFTSTGGESRRARVIERIDTVMGNDLQWLQLGIRGGVDNRLLRSLPYPRVRVTRALQENRQNAFETGRHVLPMNGMPSDEIVHEQVEDFQRMREDREHVHA